MLTAPVSAADSTSVQFDFSQSDSGFVPIFADYPNTEGVEEFYEFRHSWGEVPVPGAGKGLFISGNNHSDDLFMGYVKMLDGFVPARTYRFTVSFKLATDVEGGLVGVGGSPGESVAVKCGITPMRPAAVLVDNGAFPYHRMNIDTGRQGSGGRDMAVVGDMAKTENNRPGEYEFKEFRAEFDAAADIRGEVYLIIATDSGFEATTAYYLDDITVSWADTEQPAVTRGQAAQMLFDTADRANADPGNCTFQDVAEDAPYAEAVAWAQQNRYVNGYGNRRFGPEDSMTVEQARENDVQLDPLHHSLRQIHELRQQANVLVHQYHVCGFGGELRPAPPHGNTHCRLCQCRCVVDTIPQHTDLHPFLLIPFHETLFIPRHQIPIYLGDSDFASKCLGGFLPVATQQDHIVAAHHTLDRFNRPLCICAELVLKLYDAAQTAIHGNRHNRVFILCTLHHGRRIGA